MGQPLVLMPSAGITEGNNELSRTIDNTLTRRFSVEPSRYRADIDGLRAIAVLSVIFFHLDFEVFSGGFVGVDVFFVISGFLITRLIRDELIEGTFTFSNFYVRRARRLPLSLGPWPAHRQHPAVALRA